MFPKPRIGRRIASGGRPMFPIPRTSTVSPNVPETTKCAMDRASDVPETTNQTPWVGRDVPDLTKPTLRRFVKTGRNVRDPTKTGLSQAGEVLRQSAGCSRSHERMAARGTLARPQGPKP